MQERKRLSFELLHLSSLPQCLVIVGKKMEHPVNYKVSQLCMQSRMKEFSGSLEIFMSEREVTEVKRVAVLRFIYGKSEKSYCG